MNIDTLPLEKFESGDGHIREKLIDITGDEKSNVHEQKRFGMYEKWGGGQPNARPTSIRR